MINEINAKTVNICHLMYYFSSSCLEVSRDTPLILISSLDNSDLQSKNAVCIYISDYIQNTFFYLGRFLKKLADNQCSPITKGSIYLIKHTSIKPFTMGKDLVEIRYNLRIGILGICC